MEGKIIESLCLEYLSDETPEKRKQDIRKELEKLNFDLSELDELENVNENLSEINIVKPSENLDQKFFEMLETESNQISEEKNSFLKNILALFSEKKYGQKLSFALSLLIIGWFLGAQYNNKSNEQKLEKINVQMQDMKQVLMVSMLNQRSPMERMKAVSFTNNMNEIDAKIVSVLLNTLNHDENVNVRVKTIDALSKFADNPLVREGLIESISEQESPIVQLALVDLMTSLHEKKSKSQLEKLLLKKDLRYSVKTKIEKSLKLL